MYIDAELEKNMDEVLKIVVMGRACRNSANIKNRQPIGNMFVKAPSALPEFFVEIIEDELNVKKVTFTDDVQRLHKLHASSRSCAPSDRSTASS